MVSSIHKILYSTVINTLKNKDFLSLLNFDLLHFENLKVWQCEPVQSLICAMLASAESVSPERCSQCRVLSVQCLPVQFQSVQSDAASAESNLCNAGQCSFSQSRAMQPVQSLICAMFASAVSVSPERCSQCRV